MTETVDGPLWIISRICIFICAVLASISAMTGCFILYGGIMKNEISVRFAAVVPSGEPFTSAAILISAAVAGFFALWCLARCTMTVIPLIDSVKDIAAALFFYRTVGQIKPLLFIAAAGGVYFVLSAAATLRVLIKRKGGNSDA